MGIFQQKKKSIHIGKFMGEKNREQAKNKNNTASEGRGAEPAGRGSMRIRGLTALLVGRLCQP